MSTVNNLTPQREVLRYQARFCEMFGNRAHFTDLLMTSAAVGYLFGPVTAAVSAFATQLLSMLARDPRETMNLPLDHWSMQQIVDQWKWKGGQFAGEQIKLGITFKIMGLQINQVAIQVARNAWMSPVHALRIFILTCVVGPICEELAFRGFLQDRIQDFQTLAFGARSAAAKIHTRIRVALQAVVFALCHYDSSQREFNVVIIGLTGCLGGILGWHKEQAGELGRAVGYHSLVNTSILMRTWVFGT